MMCWRPGRVVAVWSSSSDSALMVGSSAETNGSPSAMQRDLSRLRTVLLTSV